MSAQSSLAVGSSNGDLELVEKLVRGGGNVNHIDRFNMSPLDHATGRYIHIRKFKFQRERTAMEDLAQTGVVLQVLLTAGAQLTPSFQSKPEFLRVVTNATRLIAEEREALPRTIHAALDKALHIADLRKVICQYASYDPMTSRSKDLYWLLDTPLPNEDLTYHGVKRALEEDASIDL